VFHVPLLAWRRELSDPSSSTLETVDEYRCALDALAGGRTSCASGMLAGPGCDPDDLVGGRQHRHQSERGPFLDLKVRGGGRFSQMRLGKMEGTMATDIPARGVDHVGLTVPDIESASRFLEAALGATTLYDLQKRTDPPMAGKDVERQLGIPPGSGVVHMRMMRVGMGPSLELFQLEAAPQRDSASLNDFGLQHVAVYVDDIEAAADRFERAGGVLLSRPHGLMGVEKGQGNAWVYGRFPWGGLLELITYPAGVSVSAGSPPRWTPPPA
jgi:catechol 2,3-dioxygenase-like lactoylglutathione lyase family enzyme